MPRFLISFDQGGPRMPSSMRPRLPVVGVDATVSDGAVAGTSVRSGHCVARCVQSRGSVAQAPRLWRM